MVAASKPVGGFEASTSTSASSSSSQMPASTVGSGSVAGSGYRMLDTETVRLVSLLGLFVDET